MKRFQQTQTCVLSFPPSQISFDKVFLILMLAVFQFLTFSANANSDENLGENTTFEELNTEDSNFSTAEDFTCNGISFASYKEHDPACGADNGVIRVYVNNPNNYCLVYRLYNYTTDQWHTGYQTSKIFKDLPAGKYRVKMYRDLNCNINNVSATCYTASNYFYLNCENLCTNNFTVQNDGNCAAKIYWWVETGDQFKKTLQPGESWTTTTYETYMFRAINDNPDWSNLLYDEHVTVAGCNNQTWNISPNYCSPTCTAEFEHVNGVDETACDANDGIIITDPHINAGTVLPYSVKYTYNGQVHTAGPYADNKDNLITGLAPGVYSNITLVDANGCEDVYASDITIAEFTNGCNPPVVVKTCELKDHGISDNHPSEARLLWLNFDGGIKEYSVVGTSTVVEYDDGSAVITGTAEQVDNTCKKWEYSVRLINKRNWTQWSALGRSYKSGGSGDHTTWDYYELDNYNSTFTGKNCLDGKTLNLTHNPSSYEYGFQIGNGANDKDADFGLSGWYAFTGSYTGHGDFNGDLECGTQPDCTAKTIVKYDMDACTSFGSDGSNYDYSEFDPAYPYSASFTSVTATNVFRNTGAHSCIAGQGGSGKAACFGVGGLNSFQNNSDLAIRFEVTVDPSQTGQLTELSFYEMAPDYYHHISGNSGTNNYPTKYGIRVTKNGNEIFKQIDINTTQTWSLESFDFSSDPDFQVTATTTFKFELLSYDAVSIGGNLSAWDLDNIKIKGKGCSDKATVGDFVFNDLNGNGIQENGEFGLPGVTVMLLKSDGTMVATTTTNADGKYIFTDVEAGDYKVKFPATGSAPGLTYILTKPNEGGDDNLDSDPVVMQGTNDAMTAIFTVNEGDEITDIDAGYFIASKITGVTWEDTNGNGIQDNNEPNIDGVIVMLLDGDGNMVAQTTTSGNGVYTFDNLAPGDYKVKFPVETTISTTDFTLTTPNQGGNEDTDSDAVPMNNGSGNAMTEIVSLANGQTVDNLDAGYYAPASLGNYVFNDKNQNGIQDGDDTGIDGVTVMLLDANGDMIASTTTTDGGFYEFADLAPGTYKVKFPTEYTDGSASYVLTFDNNGGNDNVDSDAVPMNNGSGNAMSQLVELRSGDNDDSIDAGYIELAKVGDFVFNDVNESGIQDAGDLPLGGVSIELSGTDIFGNTVLETTTSNNDGSYEFDNLVPGSYRITFTSNDPTFIVTGQDANGNASDDLDSDIDPGTGTTDLFTLNAGDDNPTIDAGFHFDASLPVALISFEAQLVNSNEVVLKWATASEEDNKHFIVERSADGRDFEPIGVVAGNGTTNVVNTYSLDDLDPFYGANYYRLKQVDYDGDSEYSQVETVVISGNDLPDVIVYPNPVIHNTTLRVVTPFEQDAQIEIISQSGKIVKVVTIEKGANSKQLNLSGYAPGVYFAYINFNGHRTLVYNIVKVDE